MDGAFEERRRYRRATILRWNAVPEDKFLWNMAIELILQGWVLRHNDNTVAMETEFVGLVQDSGQFLRIIDVECHGE